MLPDLIKPFSELPADADMETRAWSFTHGGAGGEISHCTPEGQITSYPLPLIVQQLVGRCVEIEVSQHEGMEAALKAIQVECNHALRSRG